MMKKIIGCDFDNTIVKYGDVFYKYALKERLIDDRTPKDKQSIRDLIRKKPNGNDLWTILQGSVYGEHMDEAKMAIGLEDFLNLCQVQNLKVCIISHKTKYPALGPRINLQDMLFQTIFLPYTYALTEFWLRLLNKSL